MVYLLREIPDELWRRAKSAAALRGLTMRESLLAALRELADGRAPAAPQKSPKIPTSKARK
jgi:hypothetical protein